MMVQHLKRRPLSRYLKDFKHSQTHCAHCRKLLDRITLVRDGKIVNKIEISRLDMLLDENGWQVEQKSWAALCRFCGDLHCKTQSDFFDIIGFKQFLFEQTEMSPGTVREYVVRLRRLGNHLHEQNISLDQLQDGFLDEILAPWLPTTSTNTRLRPPPAVRRKSFLKKAPFNSPKKKPARRNTRARLAKICHRGFFSS